MTDERRATLLGLAAGVLLVCVGHAVIVGLAALISHPLTRVYVVAALLLGVIEWVYVLPIALWFRRRRPPVAAGALGAAIVTFLLTVAGLAN